MDEYLIDSLLSQGACIDSWGVGTNLITSKNTPAFGGVYKLAAVEIDGEMIPKIKLSENPAKITNPGNKTVYRIYDKESGKIRADYITLADETFDESEDLLLFDPNATWKKTRLEGGTYTMKEILVPIFKTDSVFTTHHPLWKFKNTARSNWKRCGKNQDVWLILRKYLLICLTNCMK